MDLSVFLAKVLGLYMFFMSLGLYANLRRLKNYLNHENGPLFMFGSGARSLLLGLAVVASHNIWEGDYWKTLITLLGWAMFLRGILRLLLPAYSYHLVSKIMHSQVMFGALSLLLFIGGCYLTYFGFTAIA